MVDSYLIRHIKGDGSQNWREKDFGLSLLLEKHLRKNAETLWTKINLSFTLDSNLTHSDIAPPFALLCDCSHVALFFCFLQFLNNVIVSQG